MRDNAVGMFSGTAGIGSSCFYLKQERLPWDSRRLVTSGNFPRRYYPDRVLGYFSAPLSEHPCFYNLIETLPRALCKSGGGSVQRGAAGLDFETWWWHAFRRLTATTPQPVDDNSPTPAPRGRRSLPHRRRSAAGQLRGHAALRGTPRLRSQSSGRPATPGSPLTTATGPACNPAQQNTDNAWPPRACG